jgi:proteasome lid subunit RPN8/RPN11
VRIRVAHDELQKILVALRGAGRREAGGQLYGEQIAPSHFKVNQLTVQQRLGTPAHFTVDVAVALRDAETYFERTGRNYQRFNYIGEWHSHPSFDISPSKQDRITMLELVRDADFKGTFAVLMIMRLDRSTLSCGAWVFDAAHGMSSVTLEMEHAER